MPPKDRMLARLSDWATLAVFAGIVVVLLLPGPRPGPKMHHAPAVAPRTKVQPAERAAAAPARKAAPSKSSDTSAEKSPAKPVIDAWTKAEVAASLRECLRLMAPIAAEITIEEPMKKGPCGTPAPIVLHSIGTSAKVRFDPAPRMNCRLAAQLTRWVETVLQPAAREVLGSRITRIVGASSYACRNIYNKPDLPLSQHATGSAVDIPRFVTADGRRISVVKGWGPTEHDVAAAKKKAAEAARAAKKAAAKKKADKSAKEASDTASVKKSKKSESANIHKTGLKTDERARSVVVPAAATLTAAKTAESAFLKRLHHGACAMFGTVLGPEANEAHRNHFHFDVKERKRHGVCH